MSWAQNFDWTVLIIIIIIINGSNHTLATINLRCVRWKCFPKKTHIFTCIFIVVVAAVLHQIQHLYFIAHMK